MSDRFKYTLNGVYRYESFAQHVAQDNFPRVPIGSAGGINGWFITLIRKNAENHIVHPWICADNKPKSRLRCFFNVIKKDGSSSFKIRRVLTTIPEYGPYGEYMNIAGLLNEDNGYLDDNGGLTLEYGIHVDGILGSNGTWKFNFDDKIFDNEKNITYNYENMHTEQKMSFNCHKQLVKHHSSYLSPNDTIKIWADWETTDILEKCLQIAHGVRLEIYCQEIPLISEMAQELGFQNVVKYCEQQFLKHYYGCSHWWFFWDKAMTLNSRIILTYLFREQPLKVFEEELKNDLNIEMMLGEAMKVIAAKIFKESI